MPDLREVFEMVKQQTEPDKDSWSEQERRIRQSQRKRKYGAIALVAALVVVIAVVVASNLDADDQGLAPASNGPSIVPAGSELAFIDLATGATTGTGIVPGASEVDVSPDGTKMTFADQGGAVAVANVDGSNVQPFGRTIAAEDPNAPRWSPDGTQIVYQREGADQGIGNLFVIDVTSGLVKQITHLPSVSASLYYMAPTFSADGRSVLFTMPSHVLSGSEGRHLQWDLWTVPASGGEPALVRENAGWADVEPGGDSITFVGVQAVDGEPRFGALYVARSDGSKAHKLVDGGFLPRWSPDGSEIAYTDVAHGGMLVVNVATGDRRSILDTAEWAEWVDQQTLIVDLSD